MDILQQLNPCTKCKGSDLSLFHTTESDMGGYYPVNVFCNLFHTTESDMGGYYPANVFCNQCRRRIVGKKTDDSAVKAWNRRNPK
jgi:hypothetical protein